MIDIKAIRKNRAEIEEKLKRKDPSINLDKLLSLDTQVRELKTEVENLKAARNDASQKIGELKRKGQDASPLLAEMTAQGDKIRELDQKLAEVEPQYTYELAVLPNLPMDDVKIAPDPKDNVFMRESGKKPSFSFPFKNHLELNEKLELFDFKRGVKLAGSGWPIYKGLGARLEWALINYMLETHINNGFTQWMVPLVVHPDIMFGSGQLPKFANQQFKIEDSEFKLFMIPTAEIPLTGVHNDEIIPEEELPLRYVSYTPCFRREAGAAGSTERGLIRTHQFNKVEMFCYATPEQSTEVFESMLKSAESILEGLGLHYRSMLLCTGDMSFAAAKTVDVEVWLPGQDRYYEVSSVSNCTDYQSRRSHIRYRKKDGKPEYLHTLNGSGLATSRLMVALLENNQNEDGSINVPPVLQKYLGGLQKLTPKN